MSSRKYRFMIRFWLECTALIAVLAGVLPADRSCFIRGEESTAPSAEAKSQDGRADLDKAVELKLSARTFTDLGEVIRLCEEALKKGLASEDAEFARHLLAATRIQRGMMIGQTLLSGLTVDRNWPAFRTLALEDLEKGLATEPDQPEAWLLVGRLQSLPGGDRQKALDAATKTIELSGDNPRLLSQALLLRADLVEDKEKALVDLNKVIELMPDDPEPLRLRGQTRLQMDKFEEALADFDAALKIEPNHIPTLESKIDALLELKRFEDALKICDEIEKLAPSSSEAIFHRARIAAVQKDFEKALELLNKAAELDRKNPAILMIRAAVYQELKKTEEALKDVNAALALRPGNPALLRLRAALLAGSGKFSEAIADLEQVRKAETPEDQVVLNLQLGLLYSAQKYYARAIEHFSKVLEVEPKNAAALRGRGDAFLSIGRQAEAIKDYEKALEVDPKDSGLLNNLAWVLATSPDEKLRDGKRALELAKQACELTDYKEAHILSTLAAAYAETGDLEKAIEWSRKAVELGEGEEKEALQKELDTYLKGEKVRELLQEPPEPSGGQEQTPNDQTEPSSRDKPTETPKNADEKPQESPQ
jgi:tetratricopeptide (TPR) repeat protein